MAVSTRTKKWTLAEVHRLPDDGNKYEVVRGELFVTPPPSEKHESIAAKLSRVLTPYVEAQALGYLYHPRAVMRFEGSEVEPDLMVRRPHPRPRGNDSDWTTAPTPILIVEILSGYTRRRDLSDKRKLYADAGVDEYWIVDPEERSVTTVRSRAPDHATREQLRWSPAGVTSPLEFDVRGLFD